MLVNCTFFNVFDINVISQVREGWGVGKRRQGEQVAMLLSNRIHFTNDTLVSYRIDSKEVRDPMLTVKPEKSCKIKGQRNTRN